MDVRLLIYHYSSDENLRRGFGHLECTSLPIGGTGGHSVLLSHRNMAAAVTCTPNLTGTHRLFVREFRVD